MIEQILWPVVSLGGMGLLFGGGLAFASKIFAIESDPRISQVRDALPGANCGGCGYPGCDAFAEAVVAGEAPIDGCPVGGADTAENVGNIMGKEISTSEKMIARVICNGTNTNAKEKYKYYGITDCRAASMVAGGSKECQYGCLGLGTCEKLCPFDAIHVNENGVAEVDEEKCTACGVCVEACPKDVIELVPANKEVRVLCNSNAKGKEVKSTCIVGCIGCQICVKACPFDAMEFKDNLAHINYDKCTNCMICAEKCPTNAIYANFANRKKAFINPDQCIECGICKEECPVDAIEGEVNQPFVVLEDQCVGCGVCAEKCPENAIELK